MLLIFDLDDTLVYTHRVFMQLTEQFLARMAELGFDDENVYYTLDSIDREIVESEGAYVPWAFPTAMQRTYQFYCEKYFAPYDADEAAAFDELGNAFREADYELVPGAKRLLGTLIEAGHTLVLLTQGDREVQDFKVRQHGLAPYFDEIIVVNKKTPDVYNSIMRRYGFAPRDTAVIGNSLKSEIAPALALGARAVLVTAAEGWQFEDVPVTGEYMTARELAEVAELLR